MSRLYSQYLRSYAPSPLDPGWVPKAVPPPRPMQGERLPQDDETIPPATADELDRAFGKPVIDPTALAALPRQGSPPALPQGQVAGDDWWGKALSKTIASNEPMPGQGGSLDEMFAPFVPGEQPPAVAGMDKPTVTKAIINGKPPTPGTRTDDLLAAHNAQVDAGMAAKKQALLDSANAEVQQAKHPSLYESLYQDPNRSAPSDSTGLGRRMAALATAPDTGFPWQQPAGPAVYSKTKTQPFGLDVPPEEMAARRAAYEGRLAAKKAESDNLRRWKAAGPDLLLSKTLQGGEQGDLGLLAALGGPEALQAKLAGDAQTAIAERRAGSAENVANIYAGARATEAQADAAARQAIAEIQREIARENNATQRDVGLARAKAEKKASKRSFKAAQSEQALRKELGLAEIESRREGNQAQNRLADAQAKKLEGETALTTGPLGQAIVEGGLPPATQRKLQLGRGEIPDDVRASLANYLKSGRWSDTWFGLSRTGDRFIQMAAQDLGLPPEIVKKWYTETQNDALYPATDDNWFEAG